MTDLKTKPTGRSVSAFVAAIEDRNRRRECRELLKLMREVTGLRPKLWGSSIIGYGTYHYRYATGREGDWFLTGFSPRKSAISIYIMSGFSGSGNLMKKLGKHKTGVGCLYVRKLEDVDQLVLRELIRDSVEKLKKMYP